MAKAWQSALTRHPRTREPGKRASIETGWRAQPGDVSRIREEVPVEQGR
jgi:hypothetical protein